MRFDKCAPTRKRRGSSYSSVDPTSYLAKLSPLPFFLLSLLVASIFRQSFVLFSYRSNDRDHRKGDLSFFLVLFSLNSSLFFLLYLESPPAKRRISLDRACETDTDGQRQRRKIYRVVRARYISSPAKSIPESLGIKSYHYCTVQYLVDMSLRILCDSLSSSSIPEAKF